MKLSPRLLKLAGMVPEGVVMADIGTDHALLPVYLVLTGRCPRAIATDLRAEPIEAARQTVVEFGVEQLVDLRQGPGLSTLAPKEAHTVVLAGMGGVNITDLLGRHPTVLRTVRRLVLQPQRDVPRVRRWLTAHGWALLDEELVRDREHIYEIVTAEQVELPGRAAARGARAQLRVLAGQPAWGCLPGGLRWEVGPLLWSRGHPLLEEFLAAKLQEAYTTLEKIVAGGLRADQAYRRIVQRVADLEEVLQRIRASR